MFCSSSRNVLPRLPITKLATLVLAILTASRSCTPALIKLTVFKPCPIGSAMNLAKLNVLVFLPASFDASVEIVLTFCTQ